MNNELDSILTNTSATVIEDSDFLGIVQRIRKLIHSTQEYYTQLKLYEIEKNRMELELLQMRFNPHFLYNTLASIRYRIGEEEICKTIDALISYYRIVLSKGRLLIRVEEEIKFLVKTYLQEETVEYMKMLNGLVRDGIIAKDSMLDNKATFDEKCLAGHYAVAYHNTDLAQLPEDTAEWRYSPVWINVPANESMGGMTQLSVNAYFGVFKDSLIQEQLDQLMHAINYLNSEVGMNNFFWGPQSAGLFDVDAEGKRYYSDPEVKAAMEDGVDNGAHIKYGLRGAKGIATSAYLDMPWGLISDLIMPRYINQGQGELKASDAITYYNPGILPGLAYEDSTMYFTMNASVYSGAGQTIEGLKQFWAARTGFENQMKKLIVAESDAEFDKELAALDAYAIENGFDDKALQEFNDKFVEANMDALKLYGFIE